jgi:anti-sigma factor RsiW
MNGLTTNHECCTEDVAAYLDGELDSAALEVFEGHVKSCDSCATELRTQRQLLCTLNSAFDQSADFDLPQNFAQRVATHAESDVTRLRGRVERRRSLKLCGILALLSFALLGAASRAMVFQPVRSFLRVLQSLFDLAWKTVYDAGTGANVIVRLVVRPIAQSPYGFGLFFVLAFIVAISLLPRLIASYHRAQIIEEEF